MIDDVADDSAGRGRGGASHDTRKAGRPRVEGGQVNYDENPALDTPPGQLLAEVLDLVYQRVARVTDEDIEARLRHVLTAADLPAEHRDQPSMSDPCEPSN